MVLLGIGEAQPSLYARSKSLNHRGHRGSQREASEELFLRVFRGLRGLRHSAIDFHSHSVVAGKRGGVFAAARMEMPWEGKPSARVSGDVPVSTGFPAIDGILHRDT